MGQFSVLSIPIETPYPEQHKAAATRKSLMEPPCAHQREDDKHMRYTPQAQEMSPRKRLQLCVDEPAAEHIPMCTPSAHDDDRRTQTEPDADATHSADRPTDSAGTHAPHHTDSEQHEYEPKECLFVVRIRGTIASAGMP
jgi:hypothetical protein